MQQVNVLQRSIYILTDTTTPWPYQSRHSLTLHFAVLQDNTAAESQHDILKVAWCRNFALRVLPIID